VELKTAIIIWDGLRPEFVRCDLTPTLCALSDHGTVFKNHSAIFPTETRVNSSTIATGVYPERHGIVANRFLDRISGRVINTGDHDQLAQLHSGKILPVPTLCGILRDNGYRSLVVGSGSPGSTLLQDPVGQDRFVNVRGVIRPEGDTDTFQTTYGSFPAESDPPDAWNDLACRAFADGVSSDTFDLGILWLCDPDFTQHKHGLGSPESLATIRKNDNRLAKLVSDLPTNIDLLVASDHGFSTVAEHAKPAKAWIGLEDGAYSLGSSGIYLERPDEDLESTVSRLKGQSWIGPVFLKEESAGGLGAIAGTFGQGLLRLNYADHAPDIVYSRRWSAATNAYGILGSVFGASGIATHGSLSPYDRRALLVAGGPSFKSGTVSPVPTSAVDIAPTVLEGFGIASDNMDGRVLVEGLLEGPDPEETRVEKFTVECDQKPGLAFARVNGATYLEAVN
jgi:predicted AlkP superfamily pyrophosphatase or phosphodiesterase